MFLILTGVRFAVKSLVEVAGMFKLEVKVLYTLISWHWTVDTVIIIFNSSCHFQQIITETSLSVCKLHLLLVKMRDAVSIDRYTFCMCHLSHTYLERGQTVHIVLKMNMFSRILLPNYSAEWFWPFWLSENYSLVFFPSTSETVRRLLARKTIH